MTGALELRDATVTLTGGDRIFRLEIGALDLVPGQAVALTGASGSGKTLLLEVLGLLRAPGPGTVMRRGGDDLAGLWAGGARNPALAARRGALFGFVPQTGGLVPFLTLAENIALPQRVTGCVDPEHAQNLITRLGLADVADLSPSALSIGQRQRGAIARALAHRPPFVIADEPTAALDPGSADGVLSLLLEMAREGGSGVILSSHDLARIARFELPQITLTAQARGRTVTARLTEPVPC